MKRSEIENLTLNKSEDLCKLAEMLGYKTSIQQLQFNNGAFVSSLLNFFDDNPDAMQAIQDWILQSNSFNLEDDDWQTPPEVPIPVALEGMKEPDWNLFWQKEEEAQKARLKKKAR